MTFNVLSLWTDALTARLRELADNAEISYADIAQILSREFDVCLTKNSVIGKARRLAISKRDPKSPAKTRSSPEIPAMPRFVFEPPYLAPPGPRNDMITILELTHNTCHWPHGDNPPFLFCGKPVRKAAVYCPYHYGISYGHVRQEFRR